MEVPPSQSSLTDAVTRRKFISDSTKIIGSAVLLSSPLTDAAAGVSGRFEPITVGQIMDMFIRSVPGGTITNTVDTLKSGSRDTAVTGIVTTMFATIEVIRKAVSLNANFIIAHEPTFYNHTDDTKWLEEDEVYRYKAALLKQHNIAVWRNHDYVHSLVPDGVRKGVVEKLDWQKYGDPGQDVFTLSSAISLKELIGSIKQKMKIPMLRYAGDPALLCRRILLMPGAAGGKSQIQEAARTKPDVLVCGEVSEWETAEYFRDARAKGTKTALIILGHIASEEPGSEFMATWLREHVPGIKTTHVPAGNSLSFL